MTITFILSAIAVEHSPAAAQGSQPDTSQWKSRRSAQWGFNISVPSDWVQLNMPPVGNNKMSLKRKLENNKSVSCSISATDDSQTAGLSQQEINERMPDALPSVQELRTTLPHRHPIPSSKDLAGAGKWVARVCV